MPNLLASKPKLSNLLELNLAMVLISTAGPLGRFVSLPPPITIWWRCLIAFLALFLYCRWKKTTLSVDWKSDGVLLVGAGLLMTGHWVFFFYALQLSNVAIAMLSVFTYPVLTALLEPFFFNNKFQLVHLGMGSLILLGIYFLAPALNLENSHTQAIGFGLLSALCYALRNLIMKKKVDDYPGSTLMLYQILIVIFTLWPAFFILDGTAVYKEWPAILLLGIVTTAIGHTLFVQSFKNFTITQASIMSSIQPIYGIILGVLFLQEIPNWSAILGGAIILSTVIWESLRTSQTDDLEQE